MHVTGTRNSSRHDLVDLTHEGRHYVVQHDKLTGTTRVLTDPTGGSHWRDTSESMRALALETAKENPQ